MAEHKARQTLSKQATQCFLGGKQAFFGPMKKRTKAPKKQQQTEEPPQKIRRV